MYEAKLFFSYKLFFLLLYLCFTSSNAVTTSPPSAPINLTIGVFYPLSGERKTFPPVERVVNWTISKLTQRFGHLFDLR